MSTPRHVYAGSLTDLRGLPVISRDRCSCPGCPVDPFTCPQCGPPVEYVWTQCPHDPPPLRLQVWVRRSDCTPVHLIHVRTSSLTPAPHHSDSCSP